MKRVRKQTQPVIIFAYQLLPPELWPGILVYLSAWQRYRLVTVCKAWSEPRGLIDQSVEVISRDDPLPINLSRLVNLTSLQTKSWSPVLAAVRDGMFKKLCHLHLVRGQHSMIDDGVRIISKLQNLTSLKFNGPVYEYSKAFPYLSLLKRLDIRGFFYDNVEHCDEAISLLPGLTELSLVETYASGASLSKLTSLRYLELDDNRLVKAEDISRMTNLVHLSLTAELTDDVGPLCCKTGMLSRLTNLTSLGLSCNDVLRDEDITHLRSLHSLDVSDNTMITSSVLSHFPLLTRLVMCSDINEKNGFEADRDIDTMSNLCKLTQLKSLAFEQNHSSFIRNTTLQCLTALTSLSIYGNRMITSQSLSVLSSLRILQLTHTPLNKIDFSLLPLSLHHLDLSHSTYWDQSIRFLSKRLTNLVDLKLGVLRGWIDLGRWCETLSSLQSLERISYTTKSDITHDDPILKLEHVPAHIEVCRY